MQSVQIRKLAKSVDILLGSVLEDRSSDQVGVTVTPQTRIYEVPSLNLGWISSYRD